VAATVSGRVLATFGSRLLASAPIAISRSAWRHSPTDGLGVLFDSDTVEIFTWRAGTAALWIASIENTVTSTYDFYTTHGKKNLII
jgi:hypothetical protein